MEQFSYPNSQFVTIIGGPSADWKMYVYETGTTTLASIYSDAAKTIPTDNPIIADAEGFFASFYWTGTVDVIVTDENDNTQDSALGITDLQTEVLAIIAGGNASIPAGIATGTGDAIDLTLPLTADFADLAVFLMRANAANTGAANTPNLQVNAFPTRRIKKITGQALLANDIRPGLNCILVYNQGDDSYYLINPEANALWRDGSLSMLGALDMGGFKISNAGDAAALADAPTAKQVQNNAFNSATTSIVLTGEVTASSAIITGIDTTSLSADLAISGTGIAPGTTILSVDSPTQLTMSIAASIGGSPSLAFTGSSNDIALFVTPRPSANVAIASYDFVAALTNTGPATATINGLPVADITKYGTSPLAANDIVAGRVYRISFDGARYQLANPSTASAFPVGTTFDWVVPQCPPWAFIQDGEPLDQALYPDLFNFLCPLQGCVTAADLTITGISDTKSFYVGMVVQGENIAANTTIASITSPTSVTLNNATIGSGTTQARFFYHGLGRSGTTSQFGKPNQLGFARRSYDPRGSEEASALFGTTSSGNASITGIISTVGLFVGMPILGNGIPGSTTISSIDSINTITISGLATVSKSANQLLVVGRSIATASNDALQGFDPVATIAFQEGRGADPSNGTQYFNGGGGVTPPNVVWDATGATPESTSLSRGYIIADGVNGLPRMGPETKGKTFSTMPIIVY